MSPNMVCNIFSTGGERPGKRGRKRSPASLKTVKLPQLDIQNESLFASILIKLIKIILLIYDCISLPIYFILQRPDRRAKEAQRIRSERADINTWIKTDRVPNETRHLLHGSRPQSEQELREAFKSSHKYMGSTLNEIFANALIKFGPRPCLGYRAVVTCPFLTQGGEGETVVKDKSFRSDYTWYTYEQIGLRVQDIASGLYHYSVMPGSRALLLANTSQLEWFCASQACFQLALQIVICPEINDVKSLKSLIVESEVGIIFSSCESLQLLCDLFDSIKQEPSKDIYKVKKIVLIDWLFPIDFSEPAFAILRDSAGQIIDELLSMGQIEEAGVENPIELSCTRIVGRDSCVRRDMEQEVSRLELRKSSYRQSPMPVRNRSNTVSNIQENLEQRVSLGNKRKKNTSFQHYPEPSSSYTLHEKSQIDYFKHSSWSLRINQAQKMTIDAPIKPTDLAMIVYTHGNLGQIKSVMLNHYYLARSNHYLFLDGMVHDMEDIHCATLSLDNVIEFMTEMCVFSHGGSIGYSCSHNTLFYDGKELFKRDRSDLEALNPTFLLVRPYILEQLRVSIQNYLNFKMNPLTSFLLTNVLYDYKKFWARRHFATPIVDRFFNFELKKLFGSKLKYILCNGATECSETKDFFAFTLNVPIIELYGPVEALVSLMSVNDIWDYKRRKTNSWLDDDEEEGDYQQVQLMPSNINRNIRRLESSRNLLITSSILCPTLDSRIRLEDWEDFRTSDHPYPRGRLVVGGDVVSMGYFKRAEQTVSSFYTDSNFITWFRTEDIARVFPNGSFEIISGITDMIKMNDGQFISLSQIEHLLRNSQFVENVCAVCGQDRKFIIALVVPNLRRLALKSPGEANLKMAIGTEPEPEELTDIEFRREVCNDRLLCEFVADHLSGLIAKAGFQSIPKRFHLVPEIWTPETELVTPAFEPKRGEIQKFYASDIQSIFKTEFSLCRDRLSARRAKLRQSQTAAARQSQRTIIYRL